MSKARLNGEPRVQAYLESLGLRAEHFTKAEKRQGRTPDFRVYSGDKLAFYCEVKTSQEDAGAGSRPDPAYNRISN